MTQTQSGEIQKPAETGPLATIKKWVSTEECQSRLVKMLGDRAGAFTDSIINLVKSSRQLQACTPDSVMNSCMIAAAVNLPIEPALGQAAIVPYKEGDGPSNAQFQIMYRGIIQLCIRSGQYKHMHCTEVYEDEIESYNPITGEVAFKDPSTYKLRYDGSREKHIAGHYIYWKLLSGFEHSGYISHAEVMAHAERYSKAYQYDKRANKQKSAWSTHPIEMGNKTIIIRELKRYGVMSIDIQRALTEDRETFENASATSAGYIAADLGSDPVDAAFENGKALPPAAEDKKAARGKGKKGGNKKADAEPPTTEIPKFKYLCRNAGCGLTFNDPAMTGPNNSVAKCPGCGTLQICLNPEANGDQNEAGDYR